MNISFLFIISSLVISSTVIAQNLLQDAKENYQKTINTYIEKDTIKYKEELPKLLDSIKICSNTGCLISQSKHEQLIAPLFAYYEASGCEQNKKILTNLKNYMNARFFIAQRLTKEKRAKISQKNYYSVVTQEAELLKNSCFKSI